MMLFSVKTPYSLDVAARGPSYTIMRSSQGFFSTDVEQRRFVLVGFYVAKKLKVDNHDLVVTLF